MTRCALRLRFWLCAGLAAIAAVIPAAAHHRGVPHDGPVLGVAIAAITHGEMLLIAKYRTLILDLAARQPVTDPALRRLEGFVSLQYFTCFRGLVPGSLSDESSPFNECSHAYLAGTRALLAHIVQMPGDQSAAKALQERINAEIASDPAFGAFCSNSQEVFDSATIVTPDWTMLPAHLPTVLTLSAFMLLISAGAGTVFYRSRRFKV
ncbi:MAG: hypothetical protein WAL20_18500 [Rhodomicrobium sp.]